MKYQGNSPDRNSVYCYNQIAPLVQIVNRLHLYCRSSTIPVHSSCATAAQHGYQHKPHDQHHLFFLFIYLFCTLLLITIKSKVQIQTFKKQFYFTAEPFQKYTTKW